MAVIEDRKYKQKMPDGAVKEVTRYKATVTVKGFPRKSKTFDRKTDAKSWAEKTEYEYKHQTTFGTVVHRTKPRTLYLVGHACEIIRQVHARVQPDQKYLFASPHDKKRPNDFRTAWCVAVKRAGLEDFKFHDLRHTAASFYAQNGAGLHQIAEILGHSSFHVTKRYTHLLETDTVDVVKTTAERVFKNDGTELAEA